MKHLKSYKIFESSYEENKIDILEDIQWIEDALLELTDMGHKVNIRSYPIYGVSYPGLAITIESKNGRLLPISIGEYLLTIDSYLRERGFVGFRPYDYDNPYSASRHQVTVNAQLKGVRNQFENELSQFVKMLDRFTVNAPFDSINVSYYKPEPEIKESLYESPLVIELKDMALELTDMSYNVQIFKDNPKQVTSGVDFDVRVIITHGDNLTMKTDVKEFLFRAIAYMKDNGYKYDTHSNYGRLHFTEDGRIIISGGEARPNYPRFTMINILFKKD